MALFSGRSFARIEEVWDAGEKLQSGPIYLHSFITTKFISQISFVCVFAETSLLIKNLNNVVFPSEPSATLHTEDVK